MQLTLGQKIRELRKRDGRTQEALAEALGVTSQAISRWESNGCYPDVEIIPVWQFVEFSLLWCFLTVYGFVQVACQGFLVREACVGVLVGGAGFLVSGVQ